MRLAVTSRVLVGPHLLLSRAWLSLRCHCWWRRWALSGIPVSVVVGIRWLRGRVDIRQAISLPSICRWSSWKTPRARGRRSVPPLRSWWANGTSSLVGVGVHVLWNRCVGLRWQPVGLTITKQLESSFNVNIGRIKLGSSLVGIQCIVDLVIAGLILRRWLAHVSNEYHKRRAGANLPMYQGHTRPRKCTGSDVSHGSMHQVHLGTG
jgi:hypothetical protein